MRYPPPESLGGATFLVRTVLPNPLTLAQTLRREVTRARSDFRVSNIQTQIEINQAQTVRERLLALLGLFFAGVAILLAGLGLYGVLDYSVLQRRRELGIRIAMGAPATNIVRQVTVELFSMVLIGSVLGVITAERLEPYVKTLLYQVKTSDLSTFALPTAIIVFATLLAALPAIFRALRIDPVTMLRQE
jgi:ABC-type antimicrobial peptide transport system permease subunit